MTISIIVIAVAAGWLAGGLANLAADYLPARRMDGQAALCRPTHYWTLSWYYFRRGRCPGCGMPRPLRAPALESATVAAFLLTLWLLGDNLAAVAVGWLYVSFLLAVMVIDFEHRRVLNVMLAPAAAVALAVSLRPQGLSLANALLGGAIGFTLFWLLHWLSRGSLGAGDVKLAGVIGLMVGFPAIITALLMASILAAFAAVILLVTRRATLKSSIAYAPYMAIGAIYVLWFAG